MKTSLGHPIMRASAIVLAAAFGISACTSDPSARRVADDLINSIDLIRPGAADNDVARECMLGKVDEYSADELEKIGEDSLNGDEAAKAAAGAELAKLQTQLESCLK